MGACHFGRCLDLRAVLTGYDSFLAAVDNSLSANGERTSAVDVVDMHGGPTPRTGSTSSGTTRRRHATSWAWWETQNTRGGRCRQRDRREVFGVLAQAYQAVAKTLTKVHETELSWVAAERAASVAERSEDAGVIAATAYHLGHSLRRAGRVQEALTVSERAYDAVVRQGGPGQPDPARPSLAGGLTLTSVIAAASATTDRRCGN